MNGYKTYIVGALGLLGALVGGFTGTIDPAGAAQLGVTSLLGMTLRHGMTVGQNNTLNSVMSGVLSAVQQSGTQQTTQK